MRWIKFVCLGLILLTPHLVRCQSHSELRFAKYLIDKKYFDEAIYSLRQFSKNTVDTRQRDSIHYLLGNIFYNRQELDSSVRHFDLVSNQLSRLKSESIFFSAFNEAYLARLSASAEKLKSFHSSDSMLLSLKNFELAGVVLLGRDYQRFDSLAGRFSSRYFATTKQQSDLVYFRESLAKLSKKTPFKAALLSALIPGAGKFYAGYKGQGFLNFVVAALLAAQTWEGYKKAGPESFRFIAYGSLFTAFYISTIWGSGLSVKIKRNEISNEINAQILFAMHIPIRTSFH